jgi:dimethylargininase
MDPSFVAPARALVRSVSDSFQHALRERPVPLDVPRARQQHAAYLAALRGAGVELIELPADEAHPDACFVEDCAVILDAAALITRPGAPSRLGEAPAIAAALAPHCETIKTMDPPALLDGGDVLRVGPRLYVGRSARTNAAGVAALAAFAAPHGLAVVPVDLRAGLHLKSVVTLAAPGTLVLLAGAIHPSEFAATRADILVLDEPAGANVLALGDRVLVSTAAPAAIDRMIARGLAVVPLDIGEFNNADGAFTCLSLRIPPPGRWCA